MVKYIRTQTKVILSNLVLAALMSYYHWFENGENCVMWRYSLPTIDWKNVEAIFEEAEQDQKHVHVVRLDWNCSREYHLSLVVASNRYIQHTLTIKNHS